MDQLICNPLKLNPDKTYSTIKVKEYSTSFSKNLSFNKKIFRKLNMGESGTIGSIKPPFYNPGLHKEARSS